MKRSKRKKQGAALTPAVYSRPWQQEDRAVLAATVLWMLTIVCSLAAEVGGVACVLAARAGLSPAGQPQLMSMLAAALLLAALLTGVLCLAITPMVWWLRPVKPPLTIVLVAAMVGVAPVVTLVILSWLP